MNSEVLRHIPHGILDNTADFLIQDIPSDILTELESFENVAMNQIKGVDSLLEHLNEADEELINRLIAENGVDVEDFDIQKYGFSELDALLDGGTADLLNTFDSSIETPESSANETEVRVQEMLASPVQPLQCEPQIKQQSEQQQLTSSQYIQLFQELLDKMEQRPEEKLTMDKNIHCNEVSMDIALKNNAVTLSGSRPYNEENQNQRVTDESMQHDANSSNERDIDTGSHLQPVSKIVSSAEQEHRVLQPLRKRVATESLENNSKKSKSCSQLIVNQENKDEIKDHRFDEVNNVVDGYEDNYTGNKRSFDEYNKTAKDRITKHIQDHRSIQYVRTSTHEVTYQKRVHAGEKPHSCNVCNKSFRHKYYLTSHLKIHSGEKPHSCNVCKMSFRQQVHLTNHLKIHSGEKPHSCNVCNKSFRVKRTLKDHIKIHSGEKAHSCNVCNMSFRQQHHLTNHLKIHSGEKPHSCNVCNKSFRHKFNLTSHLKIHSGEKPHSCNVCNKSFRLKSYLASHLITHSEEKPHSCNVCNKSFRHKSNLTSHLKIHSGEKPHSCNVCNKSFRLKSYLASHLITHSAQLVQEVVSKEG